MSASGGGRQHHHGGLLERLGFSKASDESQGFEDVQKEQILLFVRKEMEGCGYPTPTNFDDDWADGIGERMERNERILRLERSFISPSIDCKL